jgi:hypothetical protein
MILVVSEVKTSIVFLHTIPYNVDHESLHTVCATITVDLTLHTSNSLIHDHSSRLVELKTTIERKQLQTSQSPHQPQLPSNPSHSPTTTLALFFTFPLIKNASKVTTFTPMSIFPFCQLLWHPNT